MDCKCQLRDSCDEQNKKCSWDYVNKHRGAYVVGSVLMLMSLAFLVNGTILVLLGVADVKLFFSGMACLGVFAAIAGILELDYFKPISDYHSCTINAVGRKHEEQIRRLNELDEQLKNFKQKC